MVKLIEVTSAEIDAALNEWIEDEKERTRRILYKYFPPIEPGGLRTTRTWPKDFELSERVRLRPRIEMILKAAAKIRGGI